MLAAKFDTIDKRELNERRTSKKKIRKSSSSNVLSARNSNSNSNGANDPARKPGEPLANVNKAFINFVNNTFDDLKRKNRRPPVSLLSGIF